MDTREILQIILYLIFGIAIVAPLWGAERDAIDAPGCLRLPICLVLICGWPFYAAFMVSTVVVCYLLRYHETP